MTSTTNLALTEVALHPAIRHERKADCDSHYCLSLRRTWDAHRNARTRRGQSMEGLTEELTKKVREEQSRSRHALVAAAMVSTTTRALDLVDQVQLGDVTDALAAVAAMDADDAKVLAVALAAIARDDLTLSEACGKIANPRGDH